MAAGDHKGIDFLRPLDDQDSDEYLKEIGPAVVLAGSLMSGFRCYGPFDNAYLALKWAEERQPILGFVSIMEMRNGGGPL